MKIKELSNEDKVSKEVLQGLMDLEVLVLNNADKETMLVEIKKMKRKYDGIPF